METGIGWADLTVYWPPWLWTAIAVLFGLYVAVRFLALSSDTALGKIGEWFRNRRAISQAESVHLRDQVVALDRRVRTLMHRDECYFAYTLVDAEWHRRQELLAIERGWALEPHISFLTFRDRWTRERGLDKEPEIWM